MTIEECDSIFQHVGNKIPKKFILDNESSHIVIAYQSYGKKSSELNDNNTRRLMIPNFVERHAQYFRGREALRREEEEQQNRRLIDFDGEIYVTTAERANLNDIAGIAEHVAVAEQNGDNHDDVEIATIAHMIYDTTVTPVGQWDVRLPVVEAIDEVRMIQIIHQEQNRIQQDRKTFLISGLIAPIAVIAGVGLIIEVGKILNGSAIFDNKSPINHHNFSSKNTSFIAEYYETMKKFTTHQLEIYHSEKFQSFFRDKTYESSGYQLKSSIEYSFQGNTHLSFRNPMVKEKLEDEYLILGASFDNYEESCQNNFVIGALSGLALPPLLVGFGCIAYRGYYFLKAHDYARINDQSLCGELWRFLAGNSADVGEEIL